MAVLQSLQIHQHLSCAQSLHPTMVVQHMAQLGLQSLAGFLWPLGTQAQCGRQRRLLVQGLLQIQPVLTAQARCNAVKVSV